MSAIGGYSVRYNNVDSLDSFPKNRGEFSKAIKDAEEEFTSSAQVAFGMYEDKLGKHV